MDRGGGGAADGRGMRAAQRPGGDTPISRAEHEVATAGRDDAWCGVWLSWRVACLDAGPVVGRAGVEVCRTRQRLPRRVAVAKATGQESSHDPTAFSRSGGVATGEGSSLDPTAFADPRRSGGVATGKWTPC